MVKYSFVVTNFNYEAYLPECLESIVGQSVESSVFEVVCVDDGSTDSSWEIFQAFRRSHRNLKPYRIENSGLEKACNYGINQASAEFIIRVDSDDKVGVDYLKLMDAAIRNDRGHDFFYCRDYFEYYSPEEAYKKELPGFDAEEIFSRGDFFATGTAYRKTDLLQIGLFPEDVKNCGLENYAVVLSLLSRGKKGLGVPGASFYYRRHHTNMSTVKRLAIINYGRKLLKKYGREYATNQYHPYNLKLDDAKEVI